jgi:hypothetical protein
MRKIRIQDEINFKTFLPTTKISVIQEGKFEPEVIFEKAHEHKPKMIYRNKEYSFEDYQKIELCNQALINKEYDIMTIEEADEMLWLSNKAYTKKYEDADTDELQRLAGFKVEKKIITLD